MTKSSHYKIIALLIKCDVLLPTSPTTGPIPNPRYFSPPKIYVFKKPIPNSAFSTSLHRPYFFLHWVRGKGSFTIPYTKTTKHIYLPIYLLQNLSHAHMTHCTMLCISRINYTIVKNNVQYKRYNLIRVTPVDEQ